MHHKIIRFLKQTLNPDISWSGTYENWEIALSNSIGYNNDLIFDKVLESALEVKDKENWFERDGFVFKKVQINPLLLSSIYYIKLQEKKDRLTVLDFGGSLGSVYNQHKKYLDVYNSIKWSIIEQDKFVEIGERYFKNEVTNFYNNISNFKKENMSVDLVLISSTLQYISEPYSILNELVQLNAKYLIIDLTVIESSIKKDLITLQILDKKLYGDKVSYPCWLFSKEKLINFLAPSYKVKINEPSYIGKVKHAGRKFQYSFILFEKK